MAITSRQLDAFQRGTVKFLMGAGIVGICLTAYTIISFSRYQLANAGSKQIDQDEAGKKE